MDTKRIELLGSQLNCLTMWETLVVIDEIIQKKTPTQHVVINASKINLMSKDEQLKNIINDCPLINADGQSIVWAGRFLGFSIPERVTGIDLFTELVKKAAEDGLRLYYFGSEEEVVQEVIRLHQKQYPNLIVAGFRNGYFKEEESTEIVEEIHQSQADILFVAFSSPKKEYWIHQYKEQLNVPFMMGVGGSFDVVAGKTKRAPNWMQKVGLEWFYRLIQEPKRMLSRYVKGNTAFIVTVIKAKLRRNGV
ncbi:WecB/TagA/CpsF family glycosyltransferase [Carnobacterium divergens]|uniref:UDP-N-acetyl-D-mannosamine transferase n=1 Tax=Carnobacterium divergens DSM 20623 TaxID=1449336 RepID=A0A0R2HWI0_CARDV|nr:WecB/TagA/CpsF family glycosyltransferase [Carnobacterium divergens]KRN57023.1 UDP-N-acetyl-D-mannosamine transferase [Carnobacterium divergens DSM 20623]MDO0874754.1 WecB/TagA/CpsF family glycosyltransferase [Carnobacterium divergens]SUX16120.1 Putative N-acetylmannosaminyltransferase [Carnobacterium divergens]